MMKPTIVSGWTRIIDYPENHLNDFAIFRAQDGVWHAMGIMGKGSFETETSLFHCSSPDLFGTFERHPPILTEKPDPADANQSNRKHAPFVLRHDGLYHMFYRRPNGTNLVVRTDDLFNWPGPGEIVFESSDARDACILNIEGTFHWYYVENIYPEGVGRSSIRLRKSEDLYTWSEPKTVHLDTGHECDHSRLESVFVVRRPEGFYAFAMHGIFSKEWGRPNVTVGHFSEDPEEFPSGDRMWICEFDNVHAAEFVEYEGKHYICRVSGARTSAAQVPRKYLTSGWVEIAEMAFL